MYIFKDSIVKNMITSQLLYGGPSNLKHDNDVLENIIKRMETVLKTPE